MTGAIVVGIDGSTQSQQAMEWAFEEARRTGAPLHLLHAASDSTYGGHVDELFRDVLIEDAKELVAAAKDKVPDDLADRCLVEWVLGPPVEVLVHAAEDARMVVVGSHGRGAVGAAALGAVGRHVARHASGPVVVVHTTSAPGSRVVLGLDPATAEPAMKSAFEEAAARELPLTVVHAWKLPPLTGPGLGIPMAGVEIDDIERGERGTVDELVRTWAEKYPGVDVEVQIVRGDARKILVEASDNSELVVVGAHGRGWFSGLLLGSTSAAVSAHALSPVLIAR